MKLDLNQFNDLDFENVGDWPGIVKGFFAFLVFAVVIGGVYFVDIKNQINSLETEVAREDNLKSEFELKQRKAVNLESYRNQMTEMCDTFRHMLRQLPTSTEIPGLIDDISQSEAYSGLEFQETKYLEEQKSKFYTEKPISIQVLGNYHQLGMFVSRVASLPRIVTLHDYTISLSEKAKKGDKNNRLSLQITAKTYRYDASEDTLSCAKGAEK